MHDMQGEMIASKRVTVIRTEKSRISGPKWFVFDVRGILFYCTKVLEAGKEDTENVSRFTLKNDQYNKYQNVTYVT
jgi:hypothetical protein